MVKIDLHFHTYYSKDSIISMRTAVKLCKREGLEWLAITDHNTIKGAKMLALNNQPKIIIGEEITTKEGLEIIGLFLTEEIKPYMSVEETIEKIKEQGGVTYIPHPFDRLRNYKFEPEKKLLKKIDIIEVFNSRVVFHSDNIRAFIYAKSVGKVFGAGSDAHTPFEIGNCFIEIENFNSEKEFLRNLKKGKIVGRKTTPFIHLITKAIKMLR